MWQDGLRLNAPGMTEKAGEAFWQHVDAAKQEKKKTAKPSNKDKDGKEQQATKVDALTPVEEAEAAKMEMLKDVTEARKLSVVAGSGTYTKQLGEDLIKHAVLVENMYNEMQQLLKANPKGDATVFRKLLKKWKKAQEMFKEQKDSAKKFTPRVAKAKAGAKAEAKKKR